MKKYVFLLVTIFMFGACAQKELDKDTISEAVRAVIDRQETAWNNHDIEGFMTEYWNSDSMSFQSGNQRLYGWDALLQRYKTKYAGEKMGRLTFSDIEIVVLNEDFVYALGRWKVETEEETNDGVYTILFKRFPDGWKIIHDHSSG